MKLNNNAKHKPPKTETLSKTVSVWKFQPAHKKLSKNFAVFLDLQAIEGHKYNGRPPRSGNLRAGIRPKSNFSLAFGGHRLYTILLVWVG